MLHSEARELLVEAYEKSRDVKRVAEDFGVSESRVYHLVMRKRRTEERGAVQTSQRGRKPLLTPQDKEKIRGCIDEKPDVTINELREKLDLSASESTVERAIRGMGYTLKMWSNMKSILRTWKARTADALPDAIRNALSLISPLDCLHWFLAAFDCLFF